MHHTCCVAASQVLVPLFHLKKLKLFLYLICHNRLGCIYLFFSFNEKQLNILKKKKKTLVEYNSYLFKVQNNEIVCCGVCFVLFFRRAC